MGIWGQDWASYQSDQPDASGLSFVFIKVTEGETYENPNWVAQYQWARQQGLVIGLYHYPHMGNSVAAELGWFLGTIAKRITLAPGDMLCLDWEGYDPANQGVPRSQQLAYKEQFLRDLKTRQPQHADGMYANLDYWLHVDTTGFYGDFLWIATAGLPAGQPGIQAPWLFHQYSDNPVDSDYCHLGSIDELRTWALSFAQANPTPAEEDPMAAFTEDDIRRFIREEASGQQVRDANAFAVHWWMQAALAGQVPQGADQGWETLLGEVRAGLGAVIRDEVASQPVRDTLAYAVHWWLQKALTGTAIPGLADQSWGALLPQLTAALSQLPPAALTAMQSAVTAALKNSTVHVQVDVTGTPTVPAPAAPAAN